MKKALLTTACTLSLAVSAPTMARSTITCPDAKIVQKIQLDNATLVEKEGQYIAYKMLPQKIDGRNWYIGVGAVYADDILSALEKGQEIISNVTDPIHPYVQKLTIGDHKFDGCQYPTASAETFTFVVPEDSHPFNK